MAGCRVYLACLGRPFWVLSWLECPWNEPGPRPSAGTSSGACRLPRMRGRRTGSRRALRLHLHEERPGDRSEPRAVSPWPRGQTERERELLAAENLAGGQLLGVGRHLLTYRRYQGLEGRFNGVDPKFLVTVRTVFPTTEVKTFYRSVAAIRARRT